MRITRNTLIKVAHKNTQLRDVLLPIIKEGKEFGSKEELEEYISTLKTEAGKEKARKTHTVKGEGDGGGGDKNVGDTDEHGINCNKDDKSCVDELLNIDDLKGEFGDTSTPTDAEIKAFEEHPAIKGLEEEANLKILAGDSDSVTVGDLKRAMHVGAVLQSGIDKSTDFCQVNPPACQGNLGITRNHMPQIMDKPIQKLLDSKDPKDRKKGQAALDAGAKASDTPKDLWIKSLRDGGIEVNMDEIEVGRLSASQSEIKAKKSYEMAKSYLTAVKPDYSIMPKAEVKELDKKCEAAGVNLQKVTEKDIENVIKDADKREKYLKARGSGFHALPDLPILVARDPDSGNITVIDGHHRYAGLLLADPEKKMKVQVIETGIRDALEKSFDVPGVFRADLDDNVVSADQPLDLARENGSTWKQRNGKYYAKNNEGKVAGPYDSEDSAKAYASGKGGKKASLRTRVIHLANSNPELRPHLLKLLTK